MSGAQGVDCPKPPPDLGDDLLAGGARIACALLPLAPAAGLLALLALVGLVRS